ncbi:MAG: ROK family protein [Candidatus Omnitrophica bacterium]|nr:ROK family protein [Candidatus Omnitrophota bacterium]
MDKAVGIDLGGTFIKFGLVGRDGSILKQGQKESGGAKGRGEVLLRIETAIKEALSGAKLSEIKGIGIGTPGLVNSAGVVFLAPNLPNWNKIPLAEIFRKKFGLPVKVENDVNAITWGEYLFGSGKGFRTIICITLGTGLGGGVVVDGKLLRGGTYSAVELGHITINTNGPRCGCGNKGCVESYVGSARIVSKAKKYLKKNQASIIPGLVNGNLTKITPKVISEACRKGDRLAAEIWKEVGADVGVMLADMVNVFNPEAIIIGGGVAQAGKPLFNAIQEEIEKRTFPLLHKKIKLLPASLGPESGIKAAAALVF